MDRDAMDPVRKQALQALANDEVGTLRNMLEAGLSVNQKEDCQIAMASGVPTAQSGSLSLPLIHIACQFTAMGCVALLIERRADAMSSVTIGPGMQIYPLDFSIGRMRRGHAAYDLAALLIRSQADPNVCGREPDGCTTLMLAAQDGMTGLVRFLLDHKADPNLGKRNGAAALFKASQNGHANVARMLVCAKADVEKQFQSGCTPIGAAAGQGNTECLKVLLAAGANPNVKALDGMSPLDMARSERHQDCMSILTQPWASPPQPAHLPGACVRVHGIQARPELNDQIGRVLEFDGQKGRYAVQLVRGERAALKPSNLLPHDDERPDAAAATPTWTTPVSIDELRAMLLDGNTLEYIASLMSRGDVDLDTPVPTRPNQRAFGATTTLLCEAASSMRQLSKSQTISMEELAARQQAAANGGSQSQWGAQQRKSAGADAMELVANTAIVRALLDYGASANGRSGSGSTPLMAACGPGLVDSVRLLLDRKADANVSDENRVTPLMRACEQTSKPKNLREWTAEASTFECVRMLLESGVVEIDARDSHGYVALTAAIEWGVSMDTLRLLIEHSADVNLDTACVSNMNVPSALAAASSGMAGMGGRVRTDVIELLLEAKADASLEWAHPDMPHGSKRTSREWALHVVGNDTARHNQLAALFDRYESIDLLAARAVEQGAVSEEEAASLKESLANGETGEAEARARLQAACRAHEARAATDAKAQDAETARAYLASHGGSGAVDGGASEGAVEPEAGNELPSGTKAVYGGKVRVQGLQSTPQHNGAVGRMVSWNADGKRRFGVKLENGKSLSLKPRNLLPVDGTGAFPSTFTCTSTELCAALQAEFDAGGGGETVIDWTHLAEACNDVVHMLWAAHTCEGNQTIYVQRTEANAHFFLAHRELVCPTMPNMSGPGLTTFPWLYFGRTVTSIPSCWEECCRKEYIVRLCLFGARPQGRCAVCLEDKLVEDSPSQLPCIHFLCTPCLCDLFPVHGPMGGGGAAARGLTCPTCRTIFPNHSLMEHAQMPGGVAVVEHTGAGWPRIVEEMVTPPIS